MNKKVYAPPHIIPYAPNQVPATVIQLFQHDVRVSDSIRGVAPTYTNVVDKDRRFVRVSQNFCELLGYRREELIGKKYDEITAPQTSNIPTIFNLFKQLGYMQGLWMLVSRKRERIVIRYESWLRQDSFIESNIEVVDHIH
jgi:PAS domain-containing protein